MSDTTPRKFNNNELDGMSNLERQLAKLVEQGVPVTMKLKNDSTGNLGPGMVEHVSDGVWRMLTPVMLADASDPRRPGRRGIMPMIFDAYDIMWISPGPILDEEPKIVTPGGRTAGGLHLT